MGPFMALHSTYSTWEGSSEHGCVKLLWFHFIHSVCGFCHTLSKRRELNRCNAVALLQVFKNSGFDSCVGRLMTLPVKTLWPISGPQSVDVTFSIGSARLEPRQSRYYQALSLMEMQKKPWVESSSRVVLELYSGKAPIDIIIKYYIPDNKGRNLSFDHKRKNFVNNPL